jgi:hypothetical protein
MLIPSYWSEAVLKDKVNGKPVTIRRFGWSLVSEADAYKLAQARSSEALARMQSGQPLQKREPKRAYNGADGVPIREEVLERHGENAVVTRNSYGARCLNVSSLLIADVDYPDPGSENAMQGLIALVLATAAFFAGRFVQGWMLGLALAAIALVLCVSVFRTLDSRQLKRKSPLAAAVARVEHFFERNRGWKLRVYETPAGIRVIATHRTFAADDPEVLEFFNQIGADPIYVRMCQFQKCFRARLTGKPWRIGVHSYMTPRPGIWPINPKRLAEREKWVREYEEKSASFAACRYLFERGEGMSDLTASVLCELHDSLSGALTEKKLA